MPERLLGISIQELVAFSSSAVSVHFHIQGLPHLANQLIEDFTSELAVYRHHQAATLVIARVLDPSPSYTSVCVEHRVLFFVPSQLAFRTWSL